MTASAKPTPVTACPLCQATAECATDDRVHWRVTCAMCGHFHITDTARVAIETFPPSILHALSRSVQLAVLDGEAVRISLQTLPRLMSAYL